MLSQGERCDSSDLAQKSEGESVPTIPRDQRERVGLTRRAFARLRYTAAVATTWASSCSRRACERWPFMVAAKRSRMPSSKAVTMVSWT